MNYKFLSEYLEQSISVSLKLIELLSTNQESSCISGSQNEIDKLRITLYRRIILIGVALLKSLPSSEKQPFSLTSIASLTRVIVESYRPFYYLTIENIKDEEREFRYLIFNLYLKFERHDMIEALTNTTKDPNLETELVNLKQKIRNHAYYKTLRVKGKSKTIYDDFHKSLEDTEKDINKKKIGFSNSLKRKIVNTHYGCFKDDKTILLEKLAEYKYPGTLSNEEKDKIEERFDNFFSKLLSNYVHSSAYCISVEYDSNCQINGEVELSLNKMIGCCVFYIVTATYDLLNLCSLAEKDTLTIECEKAEEGVSFFLGILTGSSTSAETQP